MLEDLLRPYAQDSFNGPPDPAGQIVPPGFKRIPAATDDLLQLLGGDSGVLDDHFYDLLTEVLFDNARGRESVRWIGSVLRRCVKIAEIDACLYCVAG